MIAARALLSLCSGLLACSGTPSLVPPSDVAWVVIVEEDNSGEVVAVSRLIEAAALVERPVVLDARQLVLGYSAAAIDALGLEPVPTTALAITTDRCAPALPGPTWAERVPGDGSAAVGVDIGGTPRLTADWLPPRCGEGFVCSDGACEARVAQVATGAHHACARLPSGEVRCWGQNNFGQAVLSSSDFVTEATVVPDLDDAIDLAAGDFHTCALKRSGRVVCWGANGARQLGDRTTVDSDLPVFVLDLDDATQIAAGAQHTCALVGPDDVRCWGLNTSGQLGDGTLEPREGPVRALDVEGVVELGLGDRHTCARTSSGRVDCWGGGEEGQLGPGQFVAPGRGRAVEQDAIGLTVGRRHGCAWFESGEVLCWGDDNHGQIGGGTPALFTPARQLEAGQEWTCSLDDEGNATCWGTNQHGQRGILELAPFEFSQPTVLSLVSGARRLSLGERFGCFLDAQLRVSCWGWNGYGQLGNGSAEFFDTPASVMPADADVISASDEHTCLRMSTGDVQCWGGNFYAELGQGRRSTFSGPGSVRNLASVTTVGTGQRHSCALQSDGRVLCWGLNVFRQLGNPGPTMAQATLVDGLTDVRALAVGWHHSCAVAGVDEQVWCWGANFDGQLGRETGTEPAGPGRVAGLQGAVQVAAGTNESCARFADGTARCWGDSGGIRTLDVLDVAEVQLGRFFGCVRDAAGAVWCWGINDHGQLGDGSDVPRRAAPGLVPGLPPVEALALGSSHACAITRDRALWCWGDDTWHQLGDGDRGSRRDPAKVEGLTQPVRAASAGVRHTVVVTEPGQVHGWGWNASGQLGLPPNGLGQPAGRVLGLP